MAGFHVFLDDPSVLVARTGEVARILSRVTGEPMADLSIRVRSGMGIVARDLPEEIALQVKEQLASATMSAFIVPGAAVDPLPRARRLAGLVIVEGGLEGLIRASSKREKLPWSRIRGLHVNVLARDLSTEELDEGTRSRPLYDMTQLSEEAKRLTSEIALWEDKERTRRISLSIDVVAEDPVFVGRVASDEADYAALAKKSGSSLENFINLVRALIAAAPASVTIPPLTRAFATSVEWASMIFDKPEQRDSWNLWLLQACRHGKPFSVEGPAAPAAQDDEEDIDDEELEDSGSDDEVEDDEVDDLEDDAVEDDEDDVSDEKPRTDALALAGGDAEIAQTLELFDKTRKFKKRDVLDMLAAAQNLDEKTLEDGGDSGGASADLKLFEDSGGAHPVVDPQTGRWNADELLADAKDIEDKDLGEAR